MDKEPRTPQTPTPETNDRQLIEDDFADIQDIQDRQRAAEAAHRLANTPTKPESVAKKSLWGTKVAVATSLVVATVLGSGGTAVALDHILPSKEVGSATNTINDGGTVTQAVDGDLAELQRKTVGPAEVNFRDDLITQATGIHADSKGVVQPGENVTVIAKESQVFGFVSYEAVPNRQSSTNDLPSSEPKIIENGNILPAPITH